MYQEQEELLEGYGKANGIIEEEQKRMQDVIDNQTVQIKKYKQEIEDLKKSIKDVTTQKNATIDRMQEAFADEKDSILKLASLES